MAGPMGRGPGRGRDFSEKQKPKDIKATIKKLSRYISYNKKLFISSISVILVVTILNLIAPILQSEALGSITLDEFNKINPDGFKTYLTTSGKFAVFDSLPEVFLWVTEKLKKRL